MYKFLSIQSHKGEYKVFFNDKANFDSFDEEMLLTSHFVIDNQIAKLYPDQLKKILIRPSTLLIEATEKNKSLDQFPKYVEHLINNKARRNHRLIAIGGGIIQDITCFLAATVFRGMEWWFYPTTLLAQADSCIGSKSSINCCEIKNILGTFTPPKQVFIYTDFLNSLDPIDIKSGMGEMLKVHAIDSLHSFSMIANDYDKIFNDKNMMLDYIYRSLKIKKYIIEADEFDQGVRNVMNYGHSFGHAIESATKYEIPHGVAVTIGIDMANYIAVELNYTTKEVFDLMHHSLQKNYQLFKDINIPLEKFITAISMDKKNKNNNKLGLILPDQTGKVGRTYVDNDYNFQSMCQKYLLQGRNG